MDEYSSGGRPAEEAAGKALTPKGHGAAYRAAWACSKQLHDCHWIDEALGFL